MCNGNQSAGEGTQAVVLFHSTNHAIRAERLLMNASIPCKMIPLPRHLSSNCGICLQFDNSIEHRVMDELRNHKIEFDGPIIIE